MKRLTIIKVPLACLALLMLNNRSFAQNAGDYPIKTVEFTKVQINDEFWKPRLEKNISVTIPASFLKCKETGRIANFQVAGKLKEGKFNGVFPFDDSDVYKVIEGASYSLTIHPDSILSMFLDTLISYIAAAQEPDGYLQTWRTINPKKPPTDWSGGEARWSNIQSGHELYNMGHFYEAAVAHFAATGKRSMLDLAIKNADLIVNTFGPGKIITVPGHEEIEIGLIKLYRVTGNRNYLNEAKFFIDHRGIIEGREKLYGEYAQDKDPVLKQTEAAGHAVRACYLYSAMADISAITGDTAYMHALEKIWQNVVSKKYYITGGIGSNPKGESFGENYSLPNITAYNETCAAIANDMWNYRMFLMSGDSKYIDVLERTLYNGLLAGVSLEGDRFFYPNPLASDGKEAFNMGSCTRSAWFDCSCCPSNITRFIPSIPGYVYATRNNELFVNLFVGNSADIDVSGNLVHISQTTDYPWDGKIKVQIDPEKSGSFNLKLRIPCWARGKVIESDLYQYRDKMNEAVLLKINKKEFPVTLDKGYAVLDRTWKRGDMVELWLPMEIRRVFANGKVEEDKGKVAIECGPVVYCAEEADNAINIFDVNIPGNPKFTKEFNQNLLGGLPVIRIEVSDLSEDKTSNLETQLTLIPYFAWSNRGAGKMTVWFQGK